MKVLIATDGSRFAQAALDSVAEREWADDTQFLILHVVQPLPATYIGLSHSFGDVSAMVHEAGRTFGEQMVSKAVAQLTETCGTNIAGLVTAGSIEGRIVQIADEWQADMIIVGSHGRTGLAKFFIGSIAEAVLARAHCSVEIIRLTDTTAKSHTHGQRAAG
jgi:nucleotide-binding universal stress UspA family protein